MQKYDARILVKKVTSSYQFKVLLEVHFTVEPTWLVQRVKHRRQSTGEKREDQRAVAYEQKSPTIMVHTTCIMTISPRLYGLWSNIQALMIEF